MEEASQQVQRDRIASASTSLSASSPSSGGRPVGPNLTEQPLLPKDERIVSTNPSPDAAVAGPSRDITGQLEPSYSSGTFTTVYPQEQTYYYGGFENSTGNWDDYSRYVNANGLQIVPPAIYNENPSLFFHSGYGVDSQMAYGQFSPMPSPMSPMLMEGQLYSPHQIPVSPYFSQPVSPGLPHVTTPLPISQSDMVAAGSSGQESLGENVLFGPGSGYFLQFGSFGGGLSGDHPLSNRTNLDMPSYLPPLSSPSMYPQAIGILGPYEQNIGQISQQRPSLGFGLAASSSSRNNTPGRSYQNSNYSTAFISHWGANNQNRLTPDKVGRRDRERNSISMSVDSHGTSGDWNRGPRASKTKGKESLSFGISKDDASTSGVHPEIYNRPDFVTNYENAKFFIIKSFSEDNVHKSVKYNIWASTTLGNRKLNAASNEAKDMKSHCPVFLLFSVNASGQFCGVAEMVGPVDFENNADYWQQDRWTGQFPVQWHIIKDVPNSQFRHIVLENNDNKPVTHSRDCQEVKLEQGIEMLNIFKEYNAETSILDDFSFYDDREKNLLERKARQRTSLNKNNTSVADASINQLSDSFDEVLELGDGKRSGEN